MKIKIEIQKETGIYENENIVEIDICNGHWKYWDIYSETEEKQSLTMNNFYDATFLNKPVKDAISHFDQKIWEEERELVQDDAYVRTYDTLIGYLNCRITNLKDHYKKRGRTELESTIVLFEQVYVKSNEDSVTMNAEYKVDGLCRIRIKVVE